MDEYPTLRGGRANSKINSKMKSCHMNSLDMLISAVGIYCFETSVAEHRFDHWMIGHLWIPLPMSSQKTRINSAVFIDEKEREKIRATFHGQIRWIIFLLGALWPHPVLCENSQSMNNRPLCSEHARSFAVREAGERVSGHGRLYQRIDPFFFPMQREWH